MKTDDLKITLVLSLDCIDALGKLCPPLHDAVKQGNVLAIPEGWECHSSLHTGFIKINRANDEKSGYVVTSSQILAIKVENQ